MTTETKYFTKNKTIKQLFSDIDPTEYSESTGILYDLYHRILQRTGQTCSTYADAKPVLPLLHQLLTVRHYLGLPTVISLGTSTGADHWIQHAYSNYQEDFAAQELSLILDTHTKKYMLSLSHNEPWPENRHWLSETDMVRDQYMGTTRQLKSKSPTTLEIPVWIKDTTQTTHTHYRCAGQKQAVESVNCSPEGSTILVNLPTGTGKSFVFESFAKVHPDKLTIIVVPTTSLGNDFKERFAEMGTEIFYNSGVTRDVKKRIKKKIEDRLQKLLIISPEALLGSFRYSVEQAARKGHIGALVIDEAHMVTQWGGSFRPAFQMLSVLHRTLRATSPTPGFKTILLSATFTGTTVQRVFQLFPGIEVNKTLSNVELFPISVPNPSKKEESIVIPSPSTELTARYPSGTPLNILCSASTLRTEIDFHHKYFESEEARFKHLYEVLKWVPKPFIVYTTLRNQKVKEEGVKWGQSYDPDFQGAENIQAYLKNHSTLKTTCVMGGMNNNKLDTILTQWSNRELDGVIATSAFGLGIDQQNVRTVIHVCVPESLDRFYQEVGRAGRDGRSALSIMLWTDKDKETAKGMAKTLSISAKRAAERFLTMLQTNATISDQCLQQHRDNHSNGLETHWQRCDLHTAVNFSNPTKVSKANWDWHQKTLLMMAKVGLIEHNTMCFSPWWDIKQQEDDIDKESSALPGLYQYVDIAVSVELQAVLESFTIDASITEIPDALVQLFEQAFNQYLNNNQNNHNNQTMDQYLDKKKSLAALLSKYYEFQWRTHESAPSHTIGCKEQSISCPVSRKEYFQHPATFSHPRVAIHNQYLPVQYYRKDGLRPDVYPEWLRAVFNVEPHNLHFVSYTDETKKHIASTISLLRRCGEIQVLWPEDPMRPILEKNVHFICSNTRQLSKSYFLPSVSHVSTKEAINSIRSLARKNRFPWSVIIAHDDVWNQLDQSLLDNLQPITQVIQRLYQYRSI